MEPDYKMIMLNLIASLTLDDHMGDVSNSVSEALKQAQIDVGEWENFDELGNKLYNIGVTTLWGTELGPEEL